MGTSADGAVGCRTTLCGVVTPMLANGAVQGMGAVVCRNAQYMITQDSKRPATGMLVVGCSIKSDLLHVSGKVMVILPYV